MKQISNLAILALAILSTACAGGAQSQEQGGDNTDTPQPQEAVAPAASRILVSKGIIKSANEVEIFSRIEGQLMAFNLREGDWVRKGQLLFQLDDWDLKGKFQMSSSEFEQAKMRQEEILIGQGYKREEFDRVPQNVVQYARVKSGLNLSQDKLAYHKARLEQARITSPMQGIVVGVKPLPYAFVSAGETLCTVVDPNHLIVEFSILETELGKFAKGRQLEVVSLAFPDVKYSATVSNIGSVVDSNGMIIIRAAISDSKNLLPGMTAIVNL